MSDKNSSVSADAYAVLAVEVGNTAHSHITLHMQSSRHMQVRPFQKFGTYMIFNTVAMLS